MKKIFQFFMIIFLVNPILLFSQEIYQNYVQVYGEGPQGQFMLGFEKITYTEENAVYFAKEEIMEFLSGMVLGYAFIYKVENKVTHSGGYFDLTPLAKVKATDPNITLRQLQEKADAIRIQAIYRLSEDQKTYLKGFQSSVARMSEGEAADSIFNRWEKRLEIYKNALRNAVLNEAQDRYKSRPLFISGRLLLKDSPQFSIISGEWRVHVKVHLMIKEIKYSDVY